MIKQIILLTFLGLAAAKGNGTQTHDGNKNSTGHMDSERRQCSKITQLTGILDLVNNATEFSAFQARHNLSQSDVDAIKAQAANETAELKTLQSNTTLVQTCEAMEANRKLKAQCDQMKELTKLTSLANNQTALQAFQAEHNLSAAEITQFTDEAKNASTKLATLQKNSTLVAACNADKQGTNSTSQGVISEAKSAASRSMTAVGTLQVISSTLFAAVLAALVAGLQW